LILEDNTPYPVPGVLQFRDVTVDATTASVMLRMTFPNPDTALLPGMFVRAVVKEGVKEEAMLIPQQAVIRDPRGNPLSLVVEADNTVRQTALKLDRAIEDKWLVTSGLKPGDRIIVEGIQKARPGALVRIASSGADPQSPANHRKSADPAVTSK
jgi:membrane fusion protein (multidrug efflux system)